MKPVVAEIEPVAESLIYFQTQGIYSGVGHIACGFLRSEKRVFHFQGKHIPPGFRVVGSLAELKFVQVLFPAVERIENGVMQISQGLIAPDLDSTGDNRVLFAEFLCYRAAGNKDFQGIQAHLLGFIAFF